MHASADSEIKVDRTEVMTKERLVEDLKRLGVISGSFYNVKISLKSIGYVEGGATTVIEALLEAIKPGGTIVADSFINAFPLPLTEENAKIISDRYTPSYAGVIANTMLKHPKAFCSTHPIQRFVAIGAEAERLMKQHTPQSYAYDVLRVMAESGVGRNLNIGSDEKVVGVGTTHVAIGLMGFKQKYPRQGINYMDEKGKVVTFERNWSGGCAIGFRNFIPLYERGGAVISKGMVGKASSKITDMAKTLKIELDKLSQEPRFFFCDDPACYRCRLTWEFSDGNRLVFSYHKARLKLKNYLKRFASRRDWAARDSG